jgi:GNAT superfamily N-acetyltransferase
MIKIISWEEIRHIWHFHLWPERVSVIEPTSAMNYLEGFDIRNMDFKPTFFAFIINDNIVGVNSGHKCFDCSYRSRGLWVDEKHRGYGYGKELLQAAINQAKLESANFVWSFPRKTSWPTYKSVGFKKTSDWVKSDTSEANAYCIIKFK